MTRQPTRRAAPGSRWRRSAALAAAVLSLGTTPCVVAQAPVAESVSAAVKPLPTEELEKLVAPFALYPDDLVALILPASTVPIEVILAERYLEERKQDATKPVPDRFSDPVKSLLNYPDVVKLLSKDLDWCIALGEAVVADQGDVLAAVQSFRRRAHSVGNLKSDDKLTVVVETETIKIVPTDPQVIYVPYYDPATVVYAGYPYGYWPYGYPAYYYPYAPGAALAVGIIWGAALGAIWNGGHYVMHHGGGGNYNINVDRGDRGNRPQQWTSNKRPGEVGISGRNQVSNRIGDAGRGGAAGAAVGGGGQGAGGSSSVGTRDISATSRGGTAFDSYGGSGRQTQLDSSRGASSRSFSGSSGASRGSFGGGGRAGGGGRGGRR